MEWTATIITWTVMKIIIITDDKVEEVYCESKWSWSRCNLDSEIGENKCSDNFNCYMSQDGQWLSMGEKEQIAFTIT